MSTKTQPHTVLKTIHYHGDGEFHEQLVFPGPNSPLLTFEHVDDSAYALLLRKRIIAPATEQPTLNEEED